MENKVKISLIIAAVALVLSLFLLKSLIISLITAMLLSYICYPLYKKIYAVLKHKNLSSFIVIVLIIVILIVPSLFIVQALSREVFTTYIHIKQGLSTSGPCNTVTCAVISMLPLSQLDPDVRNLITDNLGKIAAQAFTNLSSIIISLPNLLLNFFVILFLTFYMLVDADKLATMIKTALPFRKAYQEELASRFGEVTRAVIFGNLVVAIVQGALAAIGFYFAGVDSPIIWGILTVFTSLIPFLGAFAVWFPLALVTFFNGYITNQPSIMLKAILLAAYGLFVISTIDNLLKPKIIGANARIHPAIILLGVVGGASLFGFIGVIIGPLILALAETAIALFEKEKSLS